MSNSIRHIDLILAAAALCEIGANFTQRRSKDKQAAMSDKILKTCKLIDKDGSLTELGMVLLENLENQLNKIHLLGSLLDSLKRIKAKEESDKNNVRASDPVHGLDTTGGATSGYVQSGGKFH